MQISDISAYSDNALPFNGKKQVAQPLDRVDRYTLPDRSEKTVLEPEFLSADIYKGNFIDIYA
jgi:hypothetical protein